MNARSLAVATGLVLILGCAPAAERSGRHLELTNGHWFDGQGFVQKTMYASDGEFVAQRPAHVDSVVDLGGGYVVPPFGEAHNHNVESSRIDDVTRMYLSDGIFYVKNPNSLPRFTEPLRDRINRPDGIDAVFAGGGLTCTGGHPIEIADRMIGLGRWTETDGDGGFYWILDDAEDVARRWDAILETKPDFIKAYLLYSEDYDARMADSTTYGWRGLDPDLLPDVVERAHAAGLRVSVHVETAADFRTAVAAVADEINHLPGFRPDEKEPIDRYLLTAKDAADAAGKDVVVVTTIGALVQTLEGIPADSPHAEAAAAYRALAKNNLGLLRDAGVTLAVGSDSYERTAAWEAQQLAKLDVFDARELLVMWCENTAYTIFPGRKIGRLEPGFEASFLVLEGNPIENFENVRKISMRVKQGEFIELPEVEEDPGED